MTARLLPFPSVSFTDVRVAGETPEQPSMTIEEFSMDAELAPFMRGEILIFDMRLVRPNAVLNVAADGSVDWAARPSTLIDPTHIRLEKVTVTEGRLALAHAASGRRHLLTEVNVQISADTLAGPWRMDGSLRLDGMRTTLAIATGAVTPEGRMRVRLRAEPERYPLEIEADGQAGFRDGVASYDGTFKLDVNNTAPPATGQVVATQGGPPKLADYRISGRFALDHERLDLPEFRLETGPREDPYVADGTALLDLGAEPRFLVQATGAQVRIDDALGNGGAFSGATFRERFEALRVALEDLPRPTIRGTIDLDLPAIVAGDTTIRNVRLSAEPDERGWTINALSALLPGRTTLEASGALATDAEFGFRGRLLLAVAQPSGFAAWVARDVDDAIRRLPAAGFSAEVALDERRQLFQGVELVLGDTRFEGSLDRVVRDGERPALTAKLKGDALDVEGMAAFASLFVSDAGVTHFGGHDIDFDLEAGPVTLAGITAETVDAVMRLREDALEVERLSLTGLAGASISATASLGGIGGEPSGTVDASVLAADLGPLLRLLAERFPDNLAAQGAARRAEAFPAMMEDAQIDLVATLQRAGDGADLSVTAEGHSGGNDFTLQASAERYAGDLATARTALDLTVEAVDSAQLLALYGLPASDIAVTGEGSTTLSLSGVPGEGAALSVVLSSSSAEAQFDGVLRQTGEPESRRLSVDGSAKLVGDDLEPWLLTLGAALPGMGIGLPATLEAGIGFDGEALSLTGLAGEVAGVAVSGDLRGTLPAEVPHVEGVLSLGALDLALAGGIVLGEAALEDDGENWPDTPFVETMRAPFTAQLDLSVDALVADVRHLGDDVTMKARLDPDGIRLSDVSGRMLGGTVAGLVELRNTGGTGLLSGQFALDGADAAAILGTSDAEGAADLGATLTASGKSVEGLVAALAGSGTARLEGLVLPGVDPGAFGAILAAADAIGRDIDAEAVAAFAPDLVAAGRFAARDVEIPFTVASGSVRTPPIFLETEGATMTLEARADLGAGDVLVEGAVAYDPGEDVLVGSVPSIGLRIEGPFGDATTTLTTDPLAQFLTQRALEREQARVEAMQAGLLEKQRLRRETRYYASLAEEAREAAAEEERRRVEAEEKLRIESEERAAREAAEAARVREREPADAPPPAEPAQPPGEAVRVSPEALAPKDAALPSPGGQERAEPTVVRRDLPPPPGPSASGTAEFDAEAIGRILQSLPDRP
jgi:hypothetical protein